MVCFAKKFYFKKKNYFDLNQIDLGPVSDRIKPNQKTKKKKKKKKRIHHEHMCSHINKRMALLCVSVARAVVSKAARRVRACQTHMCRP